MIKYALFLLIMVSGYYTLTYSKSLWSDDQNKLAAIGAGLIAAISVVAPIMFMLFRV